MVENNLVLLSVESNPFNAEAPMWALAEPLTPTRLFFVRNHFDAPHIDSEKWRLTIDGKVKRRLKFSLKDLQSLPKQTVTVTLIARATDRAGNAQPLDPVWNAYGYGNNVAHFVKIIVR